jgi:peptidoglycan/LPS O-acetylase OafA/YrhL
MIIRKLRTASRRLWQRRPQLPSLGSLSVNRDNNLNLIRMIAALCVMVSHAWPLTLGPDAVQPLFALTGFALGTQALYVFFAISGFLVTRSFARRRSTRDWAIARALRILPGLAIALFFTAFALGPSLTDLFPAAYYGAAETWTYTPRGLSLAFRQAYLPGVFDGQPYAPETNGSLWTLQYEVLCYAAVLALGLVGAFRSPTLLVLAAAAFLATKAVTALWPAQFPVPLLLFVSLGFPFACGMAFWVIRDRLPLSPLLLAALATLVFLTRGTPLRDVLHVVALCYATFVLAYLPGGPIRAYNRLGDYSYGVYIYAWPVQQSVVHWLGPVGPGRLTLIALPFVLMLAMLSWHLIEKPALDLARHKKPVKEATDAYQEDGNLQNR